MGTFLYNVIVPHGTSDFADIILARKLTAEDEKDVQFEKDEMRQQQSTVGGSQNPSRAGERGS